MLLMKIALLGMFGHARFQENIFMYRLSITFRTISTLFRDNKVASGGNNSERTQMLMTKWVSKLPEKSSRTSRLLIHFILNLLNIL